MGEEREVNVWVVCAAAQHSLSRCACALGIVTPCLPAQSVLN